MENSENRNVNENKVDNIQLTVVLKSGW